LPTQQEKAWITRRAKKRELRLRAIKASRTREYRRRQKIAHEHDLDAKKWTRYALSGRGWKYLSFESKKKYEPPGIVDLVAIRRRGGSDPDRLEVRLLQVKGYGARITKDEREKLEKAVDKVKVSKGIAWKPGKGLPILFEGMTNLREHRNSGPGSYRDKLSDGGASQG
jgi:hypothetical protein